MKSERPSKDDEQHCRCVVWEEKTALQSLDFAFCAPSRKSSFLRVLYSCEGARRLALLQGDSRVGRARIRKILALAERELSSLDGTCVLLNVQQIKMVSREACVCAMCSRTGQGLHVCMRAYLRNLLGSAAPCWPNHCCGTAFVQFFCSLFVNLLCRKPEIESLGFTCNWLVLVGRLAWTSATCSYFRVADKFTTAKRKAGTLYQILRDTQLSFGCCVGLAQLKETPAHRTAPSLWLRSNLRLWRCTSEPTPTLTCTSCHVYRGDTCDALCTSKTSSFHSSAAGTWSFGTLVHNTIRVVQLKPTKKYLQRLLVPLAFATAKSALYSVGSPALPKMFAAVANRWADTEWKVPSSSGMVKANDEGPCLRLAHAQVENEIPARPRRAPRRGAREYHRLRTFPIWGIHIQTKSTFICGINGVGGGGGCHKNNTLGFKLSFVHPLVW